MSTALSAWPLVRTPRCALRPARMGDLPSLQAAASDASFPADLPLAQMAREGGLADWLKRMTEDRVAPALWSITAIGGDECIGQVALVPQQVRGLYWLSYWIAPDLWGRGLATESVAALVWTAFAKPEYRRIVALVGETNHRSMAVLRRVGLEQVDEAELPRPVPACHIAFVINNSKTCSDAC